MLVNKSEIKRAIVQESIVVLINNGLIQEAADMHFRNKELIDEAWLGDLIRKVSSKARGTDWAKVERELDQDDEKEDAVEKAVANTVNTLSASDQYTKQQAQDLVRRWIASDPELTQNDYRIVADLVFNTAQDKDLAADVVDAEKKEGDPVGEPTAEEPAGEESAAEVEAGQPAGVANVVQGVKDILQDPTERKMLLRGLLTLFTNDNIERALATLKPDGARQAVLSLIKQVSEMEPKTLKIFKSKMNQQLFTQMMGDDQVFGLATSQEIDQMTDPEASPEEQERAGRTVRSQVGREAGRRVSGAMGRIGLQENDLGRGLIEKLTILETLNMYIDKKISNE